MRQRECPVAAPTPSVSRHPSRLDGRRNGAGAGSSRRARPVLAASGFGRVRHPRRQAARRCRGARLRAGKTNLPVLTGRTDKQGKFEFPADEDGFWTAEARAGNEIARATIRVGAPGQQREPLSPVWLIGALLLLLVVAFGVRVARARAAPSVEIVADCGDDALDRVGRQLRVHRQAQDLARDGRRFGKTGRKLDEPPPIGRLQMHRDGDNECRCRSAPGRRCSRSLSRSASRVRITY